jgi:DNA polymerase II small subunit
MIPNVNVDQPQKGAEHLLKIRHLAPEFGAKTPISPELNDLLVIENPPDVFQTGHLHREGHLFYRGSQIVCCGAWQSQTSYQKTLGIKPTVGSASMIRLNDVGLSVLNFADTV